MPPKKGTRKTTKKAPAPVRRSARIQSRETSVESESVPQMEVAVLVSPPQRSPSPPPSPVVEVAKKYTRIRREFTMAKINADYEQKLAAEEAVVSPRYSRIDNAAFADVSEKSRPAPYPTPSKQPSWPGLPVTSPSQQQLAEVAAVTTAPPPSEQTPGWRQMFASFGGYFASPFSRKRPAEEEQTPPAANKRKRVEEPVAEKETDQASYSPSTPDVAMKGQETPVTAQKARERTELGEASPPAPKPHSLHKGESPRDYAGPSAKDPQMPTSLSTITEYTEPSFLSSISEIAASTPTKPSRAQSQAMVLDVPQITPLHPRATSSFQSRQSTPRRSLMGTPLMRRAAQLRAAREAAEIGTPSTASMFSTLKKAPPKPKETNADARQAKLERMRALQKELEELQQDEDIKEMASHRRKRVKIDNLAAIPHNLPGDPSGMFRVPEGDSDDEMEVYDDVEERSNVFEDSEMTIDALPTPQALTPQKPAVTPQKSSMSAFQPAVTGTPLQKPASKPQPTVTSTAQPRPAPTNMDLLFDFPDVGPVPVGYYASDAYKAEACALFEKGLAEWLSV